jgi:hypothetical protein
MLRAWLAAVAITAAGLMVPGWAAAGDASVTFANVLHAPYVHCAFYRSYEVDPATGDLLLVEGHSQSLTHFQAIRADSARQITTLMAGARRVRVLDAGKYLHFVDDVSGMYVLTTIYGCLETDPRSGVCVTYGAMQSRNFDPRVLSDPDAVYDALKANADPGFCDHSFVNVQEASKRR